MTKKLKPAILFINFLLLHYAYGQAQINIADYLNQRFIKYCESVPLEEIYIHTDREEYISGEDLWFNIYLIDRQSSKPSLNSGICYFELLNPENRPVVQKRIRIDEGFGPGQIVLPDTLSTGTYTIRAYTSWMKNFLPYNCFIKDIKVYNAFSNKAFKEKLSSVNILHREISNTSGQPVTKTGLTLEVDNNKNDVLEIVVRADENYSSQNNNIFYLFIQTDGMINHVSTEKLEAREKKITIPKALLSAGVNQITLFDSRGKPVCERLIFTSDKGKQLFTINSVDSCSTRSKVSLEIGSGDELSSVLNIANLSISVAPETNNHEIMDLRDFMIFGTGFGLRKSDTFRGRKISELSRGAMDSLLSSLRSNWIDWGTILSDSLPVMKHRPEKEDYYLSGKLLNRDQQAAGSGKFVLMSSPGKTALFQYSRTDNDGNFNFNLHIDEELKDLVIQPDDAVKNKTIQIESPYLDQYLQPEVIIDSLYLAKPPYISKWSVNYQVKKIYGSSSIGDRLDSPITVLKTKRFYGKPDVNLIMADYIKLPVMEEVFFELLPGVPLKRRKSGYEISIIDPIDKVLYPNEPGLMIDGVIIKDPSMIANLDPDLVEMIDVVRDRYFVGDYMFSGIVNVITKAGDYNSVPLPDYAIRLPYRVIEPVMSFVYPDYSSIEMKNRRIPDFRNTLYWNPSVKPDKEGKVSVEFWTSDITSVYEINIQGITKDGKTISLRKKIKVK